MIRKIIRKIPCFVDVFILQTISPESLGQNPLTWRPNVIVLDGIPRARVTDINYLKAIRQTIKDILVEKKAGCEADRMAKKLINDAIEVESAISTHEVDITGDYITAKDHATAEGTPEVEALHADLERPDLITMYRSAHIHVNNLVENDLSKDIIAQTVRETVKTFTMTMPDGQRNPSACQENDSMIYVTVRNDISAHFGKAFLSPVMTYQDGYMKPAEDALATFIKNLRRSFIPEPKVAYVCGGTGKMKEMGQQVTMNELLDLMEQDVNDYMNSSRMEAVKP